MEDTKMTTKPKIQVKMIDIDKLKIIDKDEDNILDTVMPDGRLLGDIVGWDRDAALEEIKALDAAREIIKPKPKLKRARGALLRAIRSGRVPPPPGYEGPRG
jgi:hypothetical protein